MPLPLQKSTHLGFKCHSQALIVKCLAGGKEGQVSQWPPASGGIIHSVVLFHLHSPYRTSPILALSVPTMSLQPKLENCTLHCGVSHGVFCSCLSAISCSRTSLTAQRSFCHLHVTALGSPGTSVKAGMSTTRALSPQIPDPPGSLDWTSPARCAFCGTHSCTARTSWVRPTAVGAAQEPESAATSAKAPLAQK